MQKNKLVHEDIKAVCNSATKKLVALGLVAATTVGGTNFAGLSYKNIACAQTGGTNDNDKPDEKKFNGYSFARGAEEFMASILAQKEEIMKKIERCETKVKKKISSELARYEHKPETGEWKFTHDNYLNIDDASVQRLWNLPKEIREAAQCAYALRHRLDYLRERIRNYNRRLERGLFSFLTYSARYRTVETSLQPQTEEPSRYDIEQAPAYVEWATNEVSRLERLARVMLRQLLNDLRADVQEQTAFEDRMRWLDPNERYGVLRIMSENDNLDTFFDLSRRLDQLEVEENRQTEQIILYQEEFSAMQQNSHRIMEENIAFFSQPYTPPVITNNDNEATQNDNNLIHNNQIEETLSDNNLIHNNQIEEIQEVTEVQENNNQNDANQQPPRLHIRPLNLPQRPQQEGSLLGRVGSAVGSVISFINPFSSNK